MVEKKDDSTKESHRDGTNPKTTEIHIHITQKGLGKIKSPMDSFDI